jgi:peptidoglycan/xylan/chitin deacetylase (PgdA/CDA1 family)
MQSEVHHASIIIDDPLLRENYGFLNYRKLLSLMDKHNFHTTIAFIPWNYNRTDKRIAALFRERPDRFSLCVHGCDHVRGEFGRTDLNYLDNKVKLATARMIEHEKRTGIPFDRVMVFPQGIFSNAALDALKNNNYWAAINTEAVPVNGHISSNFPFFLRYKPEDITDCITDPTFIVLHHDYFKNGYERLTDFVYKLNTRSKNVRWDSLGNIVRNFVSANEVNHSPADVDLSGLKFHGYKESAKILLRRYASELRDNYLCKNDFVLHSAKKIIKLVTK